MQVGIVTPRYPPTVSGGGEISVQLLATQLASRGDDVVVYSFDGGNETSVEGVPVHRFRNPGHTVMEGANAYAVTALWRHRDELASLDVVHAYNVTLTPATGVIARSVSVPSVATMNSYDFLPKRAFGVEPALPRRVYELLAMPTTGRLLRRAARQVDRFVTLSDASRRIYRENGFGEVPIDVVPNMLDPSFEVPDGEHRSPGFDLLYVGSLIKEKGVSYLVRALDELPDDVSLRVVGSGPQESVLRELASDRGLDSRIEFLGQVPYAEVRRQYASVDCFVHPGVWPEPFGRTILEAMQSGLPVVTTDIGGPAEVVPQAAFRCPPRDPAALATAITAARERPSSGADNRSFVTERFAPEVVIGQLREVYRRAQHR